ncbi:SDR family oxidoreductase [Bordetella genomosp. 13]|uniref:NAD-dependent epimerase/dehydratase domain-containing protein n=1 Tax=Bordetella genomosp. 13 TaxID=463040 RepID=A0A1W6Z8V8_9BORD|nr:SDR family oxidoreductase [Bordetella genomosp. 13]ARP93838.1 hypothetical protein CAL15_05220 [Bordetella genomosp. 13]
MKILITGASGFIGSRIAAALLAQGHDLVCPLRPGSRGVLHPCASVVPVDFASALRDDDWMPSLAGVDVVINTVGIFRERETPGQDFATVHVRAPAALFRAARMAGVRGIIQFSALGADARAATAYHRSKREADDALRALALPAAIVQPSLVYGPGGTSARLFNGLAALPLLALPGGGTQMIQPVHVDDVVEGVAALVQRLTQAPPPQAVTIAFCGPDAISLKAYLAALRAGLGLAGAQFVLPLPRGAAKAAATVAGMLPGSLLDPDSLAMLERGNTADPGPFTDLLGHAPRPAAQFIPSTDAAAARAQVTLGMTLPLLRGAVAFVWLWTAAVSLGLYPISNSLDLLRRTGMPEALALPALYGAALLDLCFGVLTLAWRGTRRRWLWLAQMALILGYTLIITVRLPEFWLHPYGPLSKNVPMLAVLVLLYLCEPSGKKER